MKSKVGVWIIGIYGSISSVVVGSTELIAKGISSPAGLITELPDFRELDLLQFDQMVFGGHDIHKGSISESFVNMCYAANVGRYLVNGTTNNLIYGLDSIENNIQIGTAIGSSKVISEIAGKSGVNDSLPLLDITNKLIDDINNFKKNYGLNSVIVVNLSSTEPPPMIGTHTETIEGFESAIQNNRKDLINASMLYAYAAFKSSSPYINFTPSASTSIPALIDLAQEQHVPYAGRDGKTGETLIKSLLALLFKYRMMKVLSWQSYNILGNMDGKVLNEPETKKSKKSTKDAVLPQILGYHPHTYIGIDHVPSLNDWKIAWDYIHFEGFLGTKMNMQFTWQGCDSMLAAPLVLDLIRLVELSYRKGETGALAHLALFFKQPHGTEIADLPGQWDIFWKHINKLKE